MPKRKDQEYCDKNCRKEDYKTRFFGMTVTEKTCKHCGSAFTTSCSVKQDYCNVYCREAAAEIRAEERQQLAKLKDLALLHYLKNEREESNTNI